MNLYQDFIEKLEDMGYEFPCTEEQFYHRAELFVCDPMFVASDYLDESDIEPGLQTKLIHSLCQEGGVQFEQPLRMTSLVGPASHGRLKIT